MFLTVTTAVLAVFALLRLKDYVEENQKESPATVGQAVGAVVGADVTDKTAAVLPVDSVINTKAIDVDVTIPQMEALVATGVRNPMTNINTSNLMVSMATAQRLV